MESDSVTETDTAVLRVAAFHEAGHAIANYLTGFPTCKIELRDGRGVFAPQCASVQGGLILSAYGEIFVGLSGVAGEWLCDKRLIQAQLPSSTRDIVATTLLINNYLAPIADDPSGGMGSLGVEYYALERAKAVFQVIDRVSDDVWTAFREEPVQKACRKVAEEVLKSRDSVPGSLVFELCDQAISDRKGSIVEPKWFLDWCVAQKVEFNVDLREVHWKEISSFAS